MQLVYLVAGGTAGHINAALALGEYFAEHQWRVEYLSGTRYLDQKLFPNHQTKFLETSTLRMKNPASMVKSVFINFLTFVKMIKLFKTKKPRLIIGAGGYVCGPTLLAGWLCNIPVFIIEQNAIAGLTNKILQKISKKVFTHFKETRGIDQRKVLVTGNPTRSQIKASQQKRSEGKLKVLIFGGSLGATQINEAVKYLLESKNKYQIEIIHQVGKGNQFKFNPISTNICYEQVEYIEDMSNNYNWADVIVARAGASTISELRIVQKPCILIPYPAATDNHQYFNALELKNENNFPVYIVDHSRSGQNLAIEISSLLDEIYEKQFIKHVLEPDSNPCELIYKEANLYVRY